MQSDFDEQNMSEEINQLLTAITKRILGTDFETKCTKYSFIVSFLYYTFVVLLDEIPS